jgi:hypothetical protein
VTVKEELYAVWLPTVTENGPEVAPVGTINPTPVSLQLVAMALVPFSEIALLPWAAPNPLPLICTCIPETPLVVEMLVMSGAARDHSEPTTDNRKRTVNCHLHFMVQEVLHGSFSSGAVKNLFRTVS